MNDKTVLLNGGRALDVTPVDGADQFLAQLLGAAPSRPAIPSLRLVDDPAGARCVGVFIASTHVGYLLNQVDEGLVATLQACEHHNAVARARATLMAEWDDPETAVLKVDLAESDLLLTEPSSLAQSPRSHRLQPRSRSQTSRPCRRPRPGRTGVDPGSTAGDRALGCQPRRRLLVGAVQTRPRRRSRRRNRDRGVDRLLGGRPRPLTGSGIHRGLPRLAATEPAGVRSLRELARPQPPPDRRLLRATLPSRTPYRRRC